MKIKLYDDNDKEIKFKSKVDLVEPSDNYCYICQMIVGHLSNENRQKYLTSFAKALEEKNITNIIIVPIKSKEEQIIFNKLKIEGEKKC